MSQWPSSRDDAAESYPSHPLHPPTQPVHAHTYPPPVSNAFSHLQGQSHFSQLEHGVPIQHNDPQPQVSLLGGPSVSAEPATHGFTSIKAEAELDQQLPLLSLTDPLAYSLVDGPNIDPPAWAVPSSFTPSQQELSSFIAVPLPNRPRRRSKTIDSATLPHQRNRHHHRHRDSRRAVPYPSPSPRLGYSDSEVSSTMSHRGAHRSSPSQSGQYTPVSRYYYSPSESTEYSRTLRYLYLRARRRSSQR